MTDSTEEIIKALRELNEVLIKLRDILDPPKKEPNIKLVVDNE